LCRLLGGVEDGGGVQAESAVIILPCAFGGGVHRGLVKGELVALDHLGALRDQGASPVDLDRDLVFERGELGPFGRRSSIKKKPLACSISRQKTSRHASSSAQTRLAS
jgi:hypothetical protein